MLGFRGCRLGILYPEITEMQARAIFKAAVKVKSEGIDVYPEVMIPLVGYVSELKLQEEIVRRVASEVFAEAGSKFPTWSVRYRVATRCLVADEIAQVPIL
jgi:pyruvate phosphate dikinase (EC 2.7.9.1)